MIKVFQLELLWLCGLCSGVTFDFKGEHQSTPHRSLSPSKGKFRALVVLVRFTDHADRDLPPVEHYEALCKEEIIPYLNRQSYGRYIVEDCDVHDWRTTDNTEAFYADGVSGFKPSEEASAFFEPVLTQLNSEAMIDWLAYDVNRDGKVDSLSVIHSGYAAEQGIGSSCNEAHPRHRIYSQGHRNSITGWTDPVNAISVGGFSISSAFDRVCQSAGPASMGVWTHEWLHTFGTPDLYDIGSRSSGNLGGLALFDIMSNPFGPLGKGTPGSLSAFTKHQIDWITPTVIENDGTYIIRSSNEYPDYFQITEGFPDGEYLLIENRAAVDYDDDMPGAGILIYHVDLAVPEQDRPGYPGQLGWPQNGNHYRVAILPADVKYDIEQGVNNGDSGDYWTKDQILGPSNGESVFPNTDSYQSGIVQSTEIRIKILSDPGLEMQIEVRGLGGSFMAKSLPTPSPTAAPIASSPTLEPRSTSGGAFFWGDNDPQKAAAIGPQDYMAARIDPLSFSPSPSPMNLANHVGYASLRTRAPVYDETIGHAALNDSPDAPLQSSDQTDSFQESGTFVFGNDNRSREGNSDTFNDPTSASSLDFNVSTLIAMGASVLAITLF